MASDKPEDPKKKKSAIPKLSDDWLEDLIPDGIEKKSNTQGDDFLDLIPEDQVSALEESDPFNALPDDLYSEQAPQENAPSSAAISSSIGEEMTIRGSDLPSVLMAYLDGTGVFSLLIQGENKSAVLDVNDGRVLRITDRPLNPNTFLGMLLYRKRGLPRTVLQRADEQMREKGQLLGEALAHVGGISQDEIVKMLRAQAELRFIGLIKQRTLHLKTYAPRFKRIPTINFPWVSALFNACWKEMPAKELFEWADDYADYVVVKDMEKNPKYFGLREGVEKFWGQNLESKRSVSQLNTKSNYSPSHSYRTLYALFRLGLVSIRTQEGQFLDSGTVFGEGPSDLEAPILDSELESITDSELDTQVDSEMDFEFDPDQMLDEMLPTEIEFDVPEPKTEPVKKIQSKPRIEAKPVEKPVQDDAGMKQFDALKKERELKRKKEKRKNEAAQRFKKGIELMDRLQIKEAEKFLRSAASLDPINPRYLAYEKFLDFMANKSEENFKEAVKVIKEGLDPTEDGIEFHLLLGMVHKTLGEKAKALAYFNKVLEFDPDNTAALREIRLNNMSRQGAADSKSKNLLSRTFSRFSKK